MTRLIIELDKTQLLIELTETHHQTHTLQKIRAIPAFLNCWDSPKKRRYRPKRPISTLFFLVLCSAV